MDYEFSVENEKEATAVIAKQEELAANPEQFVMLYNGVKMPAEKSTYDLRYDVGGSASTSSESSKQFSPGYIALICICVLLLLAIVFGVYMVRTERNALTFIW